MCEGEGRCEVKGSVIETVKEERSEPGHAGTGGLRGELGERLHQKKFSSGSSSAKLKLSSTAPHLRTSFLWADEIGQRLRGVCSPPRGRRPSDRPRRFVLCHLRPGVLMEAIGCRSRPHVLSTNLEGAKTAQPKERRPQNVAVDRDAAAHHVDLPSVEVLRLAEDSASRTLIRDSRLRVPIWL